MKKLTFAFLVVCALWGFTIYQGIRMADQKAEAQKQQDVLREQFQNDVMFAEEVTGDPCSKTLMMVVWPRAQLKAQPQVIVMGQHAEDLSSMGIEFGNSRDAGFHAVVQHQAISTKLPAETSFCQEKAMSQLRHPN